MFSRFGHRPPHPLARRLRAAALLLAGTAYATSALAGPAQVRLPAGRGIVEIEGRQQRREGPLYTVEGDVEIRYQDLRLRADRVEFNSATGEAAAHGNVRLNVDTQEITASEARYNIRTSRGTFQHLRGSIRVRRNPNPSLLLSENPIQFEARRAERVDERTLIIEGAWLTFCEPDKPVWRFRAARATIKLERQIRIEGPRFSFFDVPVVYLPYATAPAGRKVRQSGFLVPAVSNSSRKGVQVAESLYWAPAEWMDVTLTGAYLSRRGFSHSAELRAQPYEHIRFKADYYAVNDRGLPGPGGARVPQGGHRANATLEALLPHGWRAVLDVNKLTSLTFRLAFAETFAEAVNSEVRSTFFLTNNFHGFSLNFAANNYKNFLSAQPETAVILRQSPGVRLSSVDQAPWRNWPVYFGFHLFAEAVHRSEPGLATSDTMQRFEVSPRVTIPLRWGPWLGITTTAAARATRIGAQLTPGGALLAVPLTRATGELTVDIRPPSLARIFEPADGVKWKHVIEPQLVYRYVRGVDRFDRFIRFDEYDTLTDTNEIEYGITQRLYRRSAPDASGASGTEEFLSWRVAQKHYFDPTFNGAIVPGQRNVFAALSSVTPFAFADGRRRFSPVVSDLRITPGGRYDAEFRIDIDPERGDVNAWGTTVKVKPYRESFVTLAHFSTRAGALLQPLSNQVRAVVGYGEMNRRGWNAQFGISYDVRQKFLQNQIAQISYNGGCCGIGFEYRRLALGPVRSENQFRVALLIANIGTVGNLRRQEKIFE